jgi:hypothetical protein
MADIDQLIIIGNGFDKSIGFPTSYKEFLIFLLKKELTTIALGEKANSVKRFDNRYYEANNPLFEFYFTEHVAQQKFESFIKDNLNKKEEFQEFFFEHPKTFFDYKSNFIKTLFNFKNNNWGDIETIYYNFLLAEKNSKCFDSNQVNLLNLQLDYIKKELIEYLSKFEMGKDKGLHFGKNQFSEILEKKIKIELFNPATWRGNVNVKNYYFINFNYTSSLSDIVKTTHFRDYSEIISIHGNIEDNLDGDSKIKKNLDNIIFGYGDEDNEDFDSLKNSGENSLLKNIKTYNYQNNDNYKKLLGILSRSRDFQVVLYGHSCALSDRVLLREIFENDKCKSIRILHYSGIDSYYKTVYNISRIFKENKNVREKVDSFDDLDQIPQDNLLKQGINFN